MPKFDSTTAKEAGRAGGLASAEVRAAKAALRADLRAREVFEKHAEQLANQLVDAALGRGKFDGLDPKEQAQFTLKALEYGMGKARQMDRQAEPEPEQPQEGLTFKVWSDDGGSANPVTTDGGSTGTPTYE